MSEQRTIYNNGFIQVRARDVGSRELVTIDRVKTQTGCIVVPITPEGNIVLVREYREGAGKNVIGVVKGAKDSEGESSEETARRELKEELGMEAGDIFETDIEIYALPALTATRGKILFAYGCQRVTAPAQEEDEFVEIYRKVDMATLISMLRTGVINDAESCAALQSLVLHNL